VSINNVPCVDTFSFNNFKKTFRTRKYLPLGIFPYSYRLSEQLTKRFFFIRNKELVKISEKI